MSETVEIFEKAYLGKRAHDLLTTLTNQLTDVYKARGITVPAIASSTVEILSNQGPASIADTARALDITHQLASQRMEKLYKRALVEKKSDPDDARRIIWALTSDGYKQAARLKICMHDSITVHDQLFEEIGANLISVLDNTQKALKEQPLSERFAIISDVKVAG